MEKTVVFWVLCFVTVVQGLRSRKNVVQPCHNRCLAKMKTELFDLLQSRRPRNAIDFHDFRKINHVCRYYKNTTKCISQCQTDWNPNMEQAVLGPFQFVCVKRHKDILNSMKCYVDFQPQVKAICYPKCGDFRQFIERMTQSQILSQHPKPQQIYQYFMQWCNYSSCLLDCQSPIYKSNCGSNIPALIQREYVHQIISSTKSLLQSAGSPIVFPHSCKRVLQKQNRSLLNTEKSALTTFSGSQNSRSPMSILYYFVSFVLFFFVY